MASVRRHLIVVAVLALVAALLQGVASASAADSSEFVGVRPVRVVDTRDGLGAPAGPVAAGEPLAVAVAGSHGVPADARAVSLNVTVTQPVGAGWVVVYPCGEARPLASNLNFVAGQTVPNAVVVKPGTGGAVCVYTMTATHIVVDLNGYFPATADYTGIVPVRAADTRFGIGVAQGPVAAGLTLAVPVAGRYGIAPEATSVAVNVTVTQPGSGGYVTVWPCGEPKPWASNLNFVAGMTVPNAVIAGVGEDGSICLYTTATTHLVVDVGGYAADGSEYLPLVPARVFDTRVDGDRTKLPAGQALPIPFGEPGALAAVVLNVTVTQPDGPGYVTVYPCNEGRPVASNLNYVRGLTVPNMVVAPVDSEGNVCFSASVTTHLLADINGEFPGAGSAGTTGNGSLFLSRWTSDGPGEDGPWTKSIIRYAIGASGAVGAPTEIVAAPADDFSGPVIVDGLGDTVAVGSFTNFWSTSIELRDAETGAVTGAVEAPDWCGGEGLTYGPCVLAGPDRLVRTSMLGDPAEPEATIVVSSLTSGADIESWGPIRGLADLFGTADPDTVLMELLAAEGGPGEVQQFDPATGATRSVGESPAGWVGICPIGTDAMLGWTPNAPAGASVVGDATIGDVDWGDSKWPVGCSADGRFLYLERISGTAPGTLDRVVLADGTTSAVLMPHEDGGIEAITR